MFWLHQLQPILIVLDTPSSAQVFSGFLLSIVFVQSHNGMEVYSDEKDFITAQVVSTRDISGSRWNEWFTGALWLLPLSLAMHCK